MDTYFNRDEVPYEESGDYGIGSYTDDQGNSIDMVGSFVADGGSWVNRRLTAQYGTLDNMQDVPADGLTINNTENGLTFNLDNAYVPGSAPDHTRADFYLYEGDELLASFELGLE